MQSLEIRKLFFDFFVSRGHTQVPSSSLIPAQDPTILFTNAGMNQFKDLFLGKETRSYKRAVSIQKCMRAGGKHNDLDNVGFTARHLTFFEMMGNFSFGDYFKKEAIQFAWDFLTGSMKFKPEVMHASVYYKDEEAFEIWNKQVGLPAERIHKLGEADNFWQMGDTGPCGPCSEIYIDRGSNYGCKKPDCKPGCSCDRYLEVWNLVFMQFDRQPDGSDKSLKSPGVDTGMGLERLALLLEGKDTVYETDVFAHVISRIEQLTGKKYAQQDKEKKAAFHVLADHIRASTFLIADGATPSNDGRGYVLRKVIRRAALFSKKLIEKPIFPLLVDAVIEDMGSVYPELAQHRSRIIMLLEQEVEKFDANLTKGQEMLADYFKHAKNKIVSGPQAFKLYDTYGFPLEITRIIAQEKGFEVDILAYEKEMEQQRERSGKKETVHEIQLGENIKTDFTGYTDLETPSKITALIVDNHEVEKAPAGSDVWVIASKSPFYVEKGGQVSDQGSLKIDGFQAPLIGLKRIDNAIAARIKTIKPISVGDAITSVVDKQVRLNTMYNHTATHLLQAALIKLLGSEVRQAGSLVDPDYLRFDFTYHNPISAEQIKQVEDLVNDKIRENIPVSVTETNYNDAIKRGVMAIFGEKYNPEKVRVIDVPGFSAELCGGTHVRQTGDIGCFKITELTSLAAGQKRIVALTGPKAIETYQQTFAISKKLSTDFKVPVEQVMDAIAKHREQLKAANDSIRNLKKQMMHLQLPQWRERIENINGIPFLFLSFNDASVDELREIGHELMRAKQGFYFLFNSAQQSSFVALLSPTIKTFVLKDISEWLKTSFNMHGGGKAELLQGGGPAVDAHKFAAELKKWVSSK
ncbi:MAG TPA: alanine--tRNA ligase [Candidatus Babeliales bacterium]|nr:alanine--tRNA ligase [Candidatus Babeliales bacterium]